MANKLLSSFLILTFIGYIQTIALEKGTVKSLSQSSVGQFDYYVTVVDLIYNNEPIEFFTYSVFDTIPTFNPDGTYSIPPTFAAYAFIYKRKYYGDFEVSIIQMNQFDLTGVIDEVVAVHAAHTYIPADFYALPTLMMVTYLQTPLESPHVDLYPHPYDTAQCVSHGDCERPCHIKFLTDHGCSPTPQLQYDPENFAGLTYPFQQAP